MMPFGGLFDDYYRELIAPAIAGVGLVPCRSDEIRSHRYKVLDEIRALMASSTICVADITGHNANVFYELGLAHGLNRPVVLLAQPREDVPAELSDRRILWYRPETVNWPTELSEELARSVRKTLEDPPMSPSTPSLESALGKPGFTRQNDLSLEDGEQLFRELLSDGISSGVVEQLLRDAGLPSSWVQLRVRRLGRRGW
jgi:hypothetical protein